MSSRHLILFTSTCPLGEKKPQGPVLSILTCGDELNMLFLVFLVASVSAKPAKGYQALQRLRHMVCRPAAAPTLPGRQAAQEHASEGFPSRTKDRIATRKLHSKFPVQKGTNSKQDSLEGNPPQKKISQLISLEKPPLLFDLRAKRGALHVLKQDTPIFGPFSN